MFQTCCLYFQQYDGSAFICEEALGIFSYIAGVNKTLSTNAVFTLSSEEDNEHLGKVQRTKIGQYTILHVGTSTGKLYKVRE